DAMPETEVIFYQEEDGGVPVRDWLENLQASNRRAFAKCVARIQRLAELGHELRRPEADLLRDGIHELRAKLGRVQYFFAGRTVAVLLHAITKTDKVPATEIDRAVRRMEAFRANRDRHSLADGDPENG